MSEDFNLGTTRCPLGLTKRLTKPRLVLSSTAPRGACVRCHRNKEKCSFDDLQQGCSRCHSIGKPCLPRRKGRMGRRPVVKETPFGTTSILHLRVESPPLRRWKGRALSRVIQRDASAISEKFILRPDQRASHPSQRNSYHFTLLASSHCPPLPPQTLVEPPRHIYNQVHHVLDTKEGFFRVHRPFIIGESFAEDYHAVVVRLFKRAPGILADAYRATLGLISETKIEDSQPGEVILELGSRCLQSLLQLTYSVDCVEDAAVFVLLGQTLIAYNALTPFVPLSRIITRATLSGARDWYPEMLQRPDLDAVSLTPVFVDTVDCLVRREVPVLRVSINNRFVVDRFTGICTPLLPHLYDLCERSHEIKLTDSANDFAGRAHWTPGCVDLYTDIEASIVAWNPEFPRDLRKFYSSLDIAVMLRRARLYRTAALLIIHRLRFPLGVEDDTARWLSKSILDELCNMKNTPADGAAGLGIDFPLLIAMVELPDRGMELYRAFQPLRYRHCHFAEILEFVNCLKSARASGFQGLWFDLVDNGFGGAIFF